MKDTPRHTPDRLSMSHFKTFLTAALLLSALAGAAQADDFGPDAGTNTGPVTATAPVGNDTSGGVGHVSAQTNIDSSKNISVDHSVNVSMTINGQAMAYGLNAPNVLSDMNSNASFASQMAQQQKTDAQIVADFAMRVAGMR